MTYEQTLKCDDGDGAVFTGDTTLSLTHLGDHEFEIGIVGECALLAAASEIEPFGADFDVQVPSGCSVNGSESTIEVEYEAASGSITPDSFSLDVVGTWNFVWDEGGATPCDIEESYR
ncbi:MAG: hypothetical protein GY898_26935 [Proteobacteria bacterium]|nr:hypothetical protein [Pseudomonadota bacterium]